MEEKTGPQAIQSAPKPVNLAVLTAKSPAVITAKNPTVLTVKSPAVITAAHSASSEVMEGLEVLISVEKDTINDYEDFNDDTAHAFDIIDPRYEILKKIKTIISPIIIINTINDISKLYKESKKFISKRWISSYISQRIKDLDPKDHDQIQLFFYTFSKCYYVENIKMNEFEQRIRLSKNQRLEVYDIEVEDE